MLPPLRLLKGLSARCWLVAGGSGSSLTSMAAAMSTETTPRPTAYFVGSTGEKLERSSFLRRITESEASIICVGENHEDAEAQALELEVLRGVHAGHPDKRLALSLEFYDRESQAVLDEYLGGLVNLETFLSDSRPPANHEVYQPLIDHCKSCGLGVIASNCPRRYTRMVSRGGRSALDALQGTQAGRSLLPPLPYRAASQAYKDNFIAIMKAMGNENPNVPTSMLDAQALWDATMADSLAKACAKGLDKIIHITGYFHIQYGLGTMEHLSHALPDTKVLTVVILPSENLDRLDESLRNIGDLVALTDINALG